MVLFNEELLATYTSEDSLTGDDARAERPDQAPPPHELIDEEGWDADRRRKVLDDVWSRR